jgi:RNA polymerase sigma-70 factor (ECF subfamily)
VPDDFNSEDILQEVFIKIHNKIDTLKDNEKIHSWIYQITRNTIIDFYRKQKINIELSGLEFTEHEFEPDPHKEFQKDLLDTINELPEKYREALIKTEYQGLTQKELAEELGISLPGAKSRVQRARNMLRDILMQCCHIEFDRYGTIIDYHAHTCCCCTPQAKS